jgi:hypothetical protein
VEYEAVYFTFRSNMLPPFSGYKSNLHGTEVSHLYEVTGTGGEPVTRIVTSAVNSS